MELHESTRNQPTFLQNSWRKAIDYLFSNICSYCHEYMHITKIMPSLCGRCGQNTLLPLFLTLPIKMDVPATTSTTVDPVSVESSDVLRKRGRAPSDTSSAAVSYDMSLANPYDSLPVNAIPSGYQENKGPAKTLLNILLVGAHSVGKKTLASGMQKCRLKNDILKVEIRRAVQLPLPPDADRPRVDFIVFLVDMTHRFSLQAAQDSLNQIGPDYLLGKCCVVATKADLPARHAFPVTELDLLSDLYDITVYNTSLKDEERLQSVANMIFRASLISAGFVGGTSPLTLRSIDTYTVPQTSVQHNDAPF